MNKKIAILNTGSELVTGDILSTNGQYAATLLQDHGFSMGMHLMVTDDQRQIEQALEFLLHHHAVVITSGGLGPTSDDLTRFALAEVFKAPLIFHPASWDRITQRIKKLNLPCPDNNQVQALFPEQAEIFPNAYGTADGCGASKNGQWAYLLPGPPAEFKPMFDQFVLPHLMTLHLNQKVYRASWLLMNASESHIASTLDPLIPEMPDAELGYRVYYPYLEIKLRSTNSTLFPQYCEQIEHKIQPFMVSKQKETASEQLKQYIKQFQKNLFIQDNATGGILEANLLDAENHAYLHFSEKKDPNAKDFYICIDGLHAFWENAAHPTASADIKLSIEHDTHTQLFEANVHVHTNNPRLYAAETCAWILLSYLKGQTDG